MSAEPNWCFLNYPKGETNIFQFIDQNKIMNSVKPNLNIFQIRTTLGFRGYVSSNQIHLLFGTFALKMGQKGLKMALKCFGLVWYGLVWLSFDPNWSEEKQKNPTASCSEFQSSSRTPRNQTFSLAILDNLKKVPQLCHTKPYYIKPRHFRPIFRPLWPIFRAKVPKNHCNQIEWAQPLNLHIWTEHILVVWNLI